MRAPLAILLMLTSTSAFAAEVRVKSSHDSRAVAGAQAPAFKVGADEVLRGATIGPSKVQVVLRRLAPPRTPPVAVKLMRDGREVARMLVGGAPVDRVEGEAEAASAPLEKTLDVPAGPHTIFVEVGPGTGHVLVSFEAAAALTPAPLVARKPRHPAPEAKAEPAKPPKEPGPETGGPAGQPQQTAAATAPAGSAPGTAVELAPLTAKSDPVAPAQPAKAAEATKPAEPVTPRPAAVAVAPSGPAAELSGVTEPPSSPRERRFLIGVRAGGANQLQLGAGGLAGGLSARWAPLGGAARPSGAGLLVGVSVDVMHYGLAFDVAASRGVPDYSHRVGVTSVPVLAEASWSLGGRFSPTFGLSLGAAVASVSTSTAFSEGSQLGVHFAAELHAGIELPVGDDRVGLELRLLDAATGDGGEVRGLQLGGLLAQASWRFGL